MQRTIYMLNNNKYHTKINTTINTVNHNEKYANEEIKSETTILKRPCYSRKGDGVTECIH